MTLDLTRFKGLETIKCQLTALTPIFIAGANPLAAPEFRTASIKGALRFWWRARFGHQYSNELAERESSLWGAAAEEGDSAASRVRLTVQPNSNIKELPINHEFNKGKKIDVIAKGRKMPINILNWLAYGVVEYNKEKRGNIFTRPAFAPGSTFDLTLTISGLDDTQRKEAKEALCWWIHFGGLGSKARSGFGCVHCSSADLQKPKIPGLTGPSLPFPSLVGAKLKVLKESANWEDALSEAGIVYYNARHKLERSHVFSRRGTLARPIVQANEQNIKNGRRAKPMFLHVAKQGNGFVSQILTLPTDKTQEVLQTLVANWETR